MLISPYSYLFIYLYHVRNNCVGCWFLGPIYIKTGFSKNAKVFSSLTFDSHKASIFSVRNWMFPETLCCVDNFEMPPTRLYINIETNQFWKL